MTRSDAALAYLEEVLAADPLVASEQIVAARNRFLGVAVPDAVDHEAMRAKQGDRDALRETIAALQEEFPTLAADEVLARVARIDTAGHPDLESWLNRIRRCAGAADEFAQARASGKVADTVLDGLAEIAISSDEDATPLRSRRLRKMDGHYCAKSAKVIQARYPLLHDLEPDWFARIRSLKRDRKLSASPAMFGVGFFAIYLLIKLVMFICKQMGWT